MCVCVSLSQIQGLEAILLVVDCTQRPRPEVKAVRGFIARADVLPVTSLVRKLPAQTTEAVNMYSITKHWLYLEPYNIRHVVRVTAGNTSMRDQGPFSS